MPKSATKAAQNVFYLARMEAATCNDRLASREGASEEIGIDRTRLARIELGSLTPYPEEVLLMSEAYGAPPARKPLLFRLLSSWKRNDTPLRAPSA